MITLRLIAEGDDVPTEDNPHPSPWHVEHYAVEDEHGAPLFTIQRTPIDIVVFPVKGQEVTVVS